jgi:hypothetical protein
MSNKDFQNGFALGLASGGVVEVEIPAKEEQEKTVTITENGTTEILPDTDKALSKVIVETNVVGNNNSGPGENLVVDTTDVDGKYGFSMVTGVIPAAFAPNYNSENKTTDLSGKTLTKIVIPSLKNSGSLTIGKVDLNEMGSGRLTLLEPRTYKIDYTKNVEIYLNNFILGNHETITIGKVGDTATPYYIGMGDSLPKNRLYSSDAFQKGEDATIGFSCKVYGLTDDLVNELETLIDNSGVLEDTEGSVYEKVVQLIEKAKSTNNS